MTKSNTYAELQPLADQARAQFTKLIGSWSWAEVNESDNDKIRRLLTWCVPWVSDIADKDQRLRASDVKALLADIDALHWPEKSLAAKTAIRQCAECLQAMVPALPPPKMQDIDLWEMSKAARVMLTIRAAERAVALLPKRGITPAHTDALQAGIAFAKDITEQTQRYIVGAELPILQRIGALAWSGRSAVIAQAVGECIRAATDPALDECSQSGLAALVERIDLSFARNAGVKAVDIARDYLQLTELNQ